jgi:SAM-dependent methyltransferase
MYSYFYRLFQTIILKRSFYDDVIKILNYQNKFKQVVEIGCADGLILKKLSPSYSYFGYEIENKYILKLKNKFQKRENYNFYNKSIDEINFEQFDPQDTLIILVGVFHHISDKKIINFLKKTLNFSVYAIDAVRLEDQNFLTKILLDNDQGEFIRKENEYKNILENYNFILARNKYLRVPYDHLVSFKRLESWYLESILK